MTKKSRFIGQFVDELYGAIIALGIANILFQEAFEPTSILQIATIFIITFVVLMYWWDWAEYISTEVYSTKRELFIDFMLLFTMELFFVFYNQPLYLASAFIALGIGDFLWVSNFIYETRKEGDFSIIPSIYLLEKLLCITIYIISCIFCFIIANITFPFDTTNQLNKWIQVILILLVFLLVRKVGFNHVRGDKYYLFPAKIEDAKDIIEVNKSYLNNYEKTTGFLISELDYDEILESIRDDKNQYFVANGEEQEFLGYVKIDYQIEADLLPDINWNLIDKNNKKDFETFEYIYISQLAIKKEKIRKEIGTFIYNALFKKFPDRNFIAFVAKKPHLNRASREFHKKLGYDAIGIFKRNEYCGFNNYESYFFYKKRLIDPKKLPILKKIQKNICE